MALELGDIGGLTVADLVVAIPEARGIMDYYGIDYCCGGKIPFTEACRQANLDPAVILVAVEHVKAEVQAGTPILFDTWTIPLLLDFIVQHHHRYVRENIQPISDLLDKVCDVHGDQDRYLIRTRDIFGRLAVELLDHMDAEEKILFPAIRTQSAIDLSVTCSSLEQEHEEAGRLVKALRECTSGYVPPPHACPTFQLTYTKLRQFDNDLMQHIHLENNILFPKISADESHH